MSTDGARILVVEDDRGIATMLGRGLRVAGHAVTVVGGVEEARTEWVAGRELPPTCRSRSPTPTSSR